MENGDKTRSGLTAAKILQVEENGDEKAGGVSVQCMFNPYEYTVTKQNKFTYKPKNNNQAPSLNFDGPGSQTLKLKIYFDTFESGEDVTQTTRKLWDLMDPKKQDGGGNDDKKVDPPYVAFHWGVFYFVSVIKTMTQKFTLFKNDGTPVRAEVNITFEQHKDQKDYDRQNPTSGGGPVDRIWQTKPGDRLDLIAAKVYGDATHWPKIASYNGIQNPHQLKSGTLLSIPEL
ncbi:MAG: LysM peptidoglycan-binding domain-containing protein [Chloroflexota bacterium]